MAFKEKYTITPAYLSVPSKRRSGLQMSPGVKFIVAHDTGNPKSTARGNRNYYENSKNEMSASAHIFVDDKEIIECIPALTSNKPEKAWHVMYGVPTDNQLFGFNANDAAVGVEYCYGDNINADESYRKYIWVIAKICYTYSLDPAKSIVGHCFLDPKRKTDPVTGLLQSRRTYEQLLKDIVSEFNECTGVANDEYLFTPSPGIGKVIHRLNIRKGFPTTKADIIEIISPGTSISYSGFVTNGEAVNGNPKWYKNEAGNYFWSGGIEFNSEKQYAKTKEDNNWYISKLGIDKLWIKTKGEGVKVAIIDSGIDKNHPDIDYSRIVLKRNFLYEGEDEIQLNNVEDENGHGTHCTGILAGQGIKTFGVAPNVSLFIGKIANSLHEIEQNKLFKAIEWAYNNDADIISISISIDELDDQYAKLIEDLDKKKKGILIGALSNVGDHGYNVIGYPFSLKSCIGVGATDKVFKIDEYTARSNSLDILAPGRDIYSTWINGGYKTESGCSMATPIVAGIVALFLSYAYKLSKSFSKDEIISIIKNSASNFVHYKTLPGTSFPIINPENIFNNL
jgi:subtilisin family serine protease